MEITQPVFIFKQLSYRALLQVHPRWGKCLWLKRGAGRLVGGRCQREGEDFQKSLCPGKGGVLGRGAPGWKARGIGGGAEICDLNSEWRMPRKNPNQ